MGVEIFQPIIEPETGGRQLVSFFMISYNQEHFIREALEGAFAQTYQPLEIILSDDCSPDRTFEIIRQMVLQYKGPHRIVLNQNEHNLGLCGNVNRLLDLASGEIVVIAGGDDISLPDRVEKSWRILQENPTANCVSFQIQTIDKDGVPSAIGITNRVQLEKFTLSDFISRKGFHLNGASRAFRKNVYAYFGPLSRNAATEDSTILLRCLMMGNACYSKDVEVLYRVHGENYYASDKKYLISYRKIYWQYLTDIKTALLKGAIFPDEAVSLKKVLRRRLKQKLLDSGFALANTKVGFFIKNIMFSTVVGLREKLSYFVRSLSCLK